MDKKIFESTKSDLHEANKHILQYKPLQHTKTQTYLITGQLS